LLATDPALATCLVTDEAGGGRSPLHLLADAPGHRPNAPATVSILVAAGADVNVAAVGMWHQETPLHWAASNDDLILIDALLDAGAAIEAPGSSIDGGPPLSSAVGYGQWNGGRRLVDRGAATKLWHEAALGLMPEIVRRFDIDPPPRDALSAPFWNACRGGHLVIARALLERGADLNWVAPWSGQTPLDIAQDGRHSDLVVWLTGKGANHGTGV
jgi:ankyrin repeat protein